MVCPCRMKASPDIPVAAGDGADEAEGCAEVVRCVLPDLMGRGLRAAVGAGEQAFSAFPWEAPCVSRTRRCSGRIQLSVAPLPNTLKPDGQVVFSS